MIKSTASFAGLVRGCMPLRGVASASYNEG